MNALLAALAIWHRLTATPVAYVLLWAALFSLGTGAVVIYRTAWGQSKTWRKCAALSLLVHVLLACVAMTVQIVSGEAGGEGAAPIRVRILDISGDGAETQAAASRGLLVDDRASRATSPPIGETVLLPETESDVQSAMPTAPTLLDSPAVVENPATIDAAADVAAYAAPLVAEGPPHDAQPPPAAERNADDTTGPSPPPSSPPMANGGAATVAGSAASAEAATADSIVPSSGSGGPPAGAGDPYADRTAPNRMGLVEGQGGSRETEAAVAAALGWLAVAQAPDGRWSAAQHGAGVERHVLGENRHGAGRDADTGITALAVLALLGAGHSHVAGDYHETVERGLEYLLRSQAADGNLYGGAGLYSQMYCHSMATFALAEAQAMTRDRRLAAGVSRAVEYSVRAQDPVTGGWRYRPHDSGDTSQLGWQVMALASAERAGLELPLTTWSGVDRFLRSVRRGQLGGLASYRADSRMSTSMTAEALYCRLMLTRRAGTGIDERAAAEAARQILTELPAARSANVYYWYYATLALHERSGANDEAAADWQTWNRELTSVLVDAQEARGPDAGSWAPDAMWGGYGGRVFSTALSAMCLEVYYRYVPAESPGAQRTEVVVRPGGANGAR